MPESRAPARGRPNVAVVVGSGGLKCAAAFGAIEVLRSAGVPIDLVVASSGGCIFAHWLATGARDPDTQVDTLVRCLRGMFGTVDRWAVVRALLPGLFRFRADVALIDDRRLNAAIRDHVGDATFADTTIPLRIVATDAATGESVVLSTGRIADAFRASVAIPLLLRPWSVDGRLLADGGLSNPLPVDVAIREGADVIVAMGFEEPMQARIGSMSELLMHVTSATTNQLLRAQFAFHNVAHHAEVIPIMPELDRRVGLRDFHQVPYLVEQGRLAAERQIPYLRRLLEPRAPAA